MKLKTIISNCFICSSILITQAALAASYLPSDTMTPGSIQLDNILVDSTGNTGASLTAVDNANLHGGQVYVLVMDELRRSSGSQDATYNSVTQKIIAQNVIESGNLTHDITLLLTGIIGESKVAEFTVTELHSRILDETDQVVKDVVFLQGPQGDQGPAGSSGPQGEMGTPGPAGKQGATGSAGAKGEKGPQGETGPAGAIGPKGDKGENGAQGPKGDQGAQGPDGPKGATGDQGPDGPKGATGAQGPTGPKGATGVQGPTGPKGTTGTQGPAGPKGATGAQGPAGPKGATGAQGPAGPKGATGVQGPAGTMGAPGMQGPPGPAGSFSSIQIVPGRQNVFIPVGGEAEVSAMCPTGTSVVGGGCSLNAIAASRELTPRHNGPLTDGTGWKCVWTASFMDVIGQDIDAYAICVK